MQRTAAHHLRVFGSILLVFAVVAVGAAARARAEPSTPLLEDNLRANHRKAIDSSSDSNLEAALGGAEGFSTKSLAAVEDRLRAALKRDRPRASPRLVAFLYPGRTSIERLRAMREIFVDIELTIDPCSRSLCDDALAKHVELVGAAVGDASQRGEGYVLSYKNLTLKAETDVRGEEVITFSVPVADAVAASKRPGGGQALMAARRHAETDYVPILTKTIAQRASLLRVPTEGPPSVTRAGNNVDIALKLKADRNRQEQQVLDAIRAIGQALRASPATPKDGKISLTADAASRSVAPVRFRCPIGPAQLYADGSLDGKSLLASYLEKVNDDKNAQRMDMDETGAGDNGPAGEPNDDEAIAVLTSNFSSLGGCARTEAGRNSSFRGVTITFGWSASGRAEHVDVKEPQLESTPLPGCLRKAFESIHLPRFSGATRTIEYPIRLK